MSSKEPVEEQEEKSQKDMDSNNLSTVCPTSDVTTVLKDVKGTPSTSKSSPAAETSSPKVFENARSSSKTSAHSEILMEAQDSSGESKQSSESDKTITPLPETKASSSMYHVSAKEVDSKIVEIKDTDSKDNVPESIKDDDVPCTEADDSDSQWTDISDAVTDSEAEEPDTGVEKHDSSGTSIRYSYSTPVKDKDTTANSSNLSEEEKQNFAFISEQLSILNKESSTVTTAIHKSQKKSKKATPNKHKTDPKKTPRKQTTSSMSSSEAEHRRSVRKRLETTPTSTPKKQKVDAGVSADSADDADTSQDDALQIDEQDLDETLDRKARRKGLTAVNVKNIIHELVKNVDVQQMLRNHMNQQLSNMSGPEGLAFEPKMTRAKVKEVIEKGVPLQTWPLSPVKKTVAPKKPSILDIDFPDDEEDDEYSPDKDAEDHHESDDDLESMMSSHASDLGSPLPPTPSTPTITTPFRARTPQTGDTETFRSPMSTASGVSSRRSSVLGQHFKTSMAALEDSSTQGSVTQSDTIAKRTRSKLPLTDTSLTAIEEAFVAPDITPDMYDTECDDSEWQEFLRSLVKSDADPVDDDVNDPEFDFLEEAEKLQETEEDFRFDKPFRVSKKELNQLITELDELFPEPEDEDKTLELEESTVQESPVENPRKAASSSLSKTELEENSLIVSPEERLLIEDQMRKHVQLTTQQFFLCKGSEDFEQMTSTYRQLLRELDIFRCVSMARDMSSYNVCNLQGAIDLVGEDRTWNLSQEAEDASTYSLEETNSNATDSDKESADCNKKYRKKASSYPLLPSQVEVFWNSPVFLYPQLLPRQRFFPLEEASKCRVSFTSGEDNLIALAFEQFHKMKNFRSLMQKYLLPAKSVKQINLRIKNLKSKRTPDNALKFFLKHKKPLPRALVVEAFYPDQIKAPKDQDDSVLPKWAKRKRFKDKKSSKKKRKGVRKRSLSLTLPLTTESTSSQGQEMDEAYSPVKKKPRSAPVSPTEDIANRRHVEDTYPLLSKIPADKTIITPEGVFIPFKVLASSANTSNVPSTPPKPSTSVSEASQALPTSLVESLGKLKGSIRIIPGTKPGEPPRIISSLIAVQGRPVQLACTQSQDDPQEMSESSESRPRERDADCEVEERPSGENGTEVEENVMEIEPVTNAMEVEPVTDPAVEETVMDVQHEPACASVPQGDTEEVTDERSCDYEHKDDSESSVRHADNQTNISFQTNPKATGETSSGASGMHNQTDSSSCEEQHRTPLHDKVLQCAPDSCETPDAVVSDEITEDKHISQGNLETSSCAETNVSMVSEDNQTDSGVSVQPEQAQEIVVGEVMEDQLEAERAANQIMNMQMPEQCPVSGDGSETPNETHVPEEKPCVQMTSIEAEVDTPSDLPGKYTVSLDITTADSAETPGSKTQLLEDCKSSEDCLGDANTDPQLQRNQSTDEVTENVCTPEQSSEGVKTPEMRDSVPSSSLGSSEPVFEVSADSEECTAEEDQSQVHSDVLDTMETNDMITDSPLKSSEDHPSTTHDHVCVYPSTPSRQNTGVETGMIDNSKQDADLKTAKDNSPSNSRNVCESPKVTRTPLEIIAAFCPYYGSPSPPVKSPTPQQSLLERTPPKKQSETGYRELRPKPPCSLSGPDSNSPKPVSPFLDKVISKSPKRVLRGNRTILPKTFVLDTNKESPTKRAARSLKKRAQMICQRTSPCKLLPQTEMQRIQRLQICSLAKPTKVNQSRRKQKTPVRKVLMRPSYRRSNSESEDLSESEEGTSKRSGDSPRVRAGAKRKLSDADKKQEESDGGQSEVEDAGMSQEDSQNEDEVEDSQNSDQSHLDMLMAASTTLGFGQKKSTSRERVKGKTNKKKEQTLAMLAPDLLEMDPKKDEKDTAFAQAYLDRVRDCLKDNLDVYEEFLTLMYNLGKDGQSAIEIYQKMQKLFKDFPELLDEFAGFLLPEQAVVCGCFMKNQETIKARTFLRKLEVNYEKQPNHFQKILKVLTQWYQNPQRSPQDLQTSIKPLLRGMPHLLEQFSLFFPDEKPPESYMNDYETMTLSDSDFEEGASVESFEEVDFPDDFDTYRTNWCTCDCHQDPNEVKQFKRLKHCFSCSLKVIDGKLYFQPSRNKLYPAKVIVHKSVSPDHRSKSVSTAEMEDDQMADKENLNCLSARPTVISPSASHSSPVRPKRIKLKISRKKAGQKRFLTLCEIGGSPSKQEPVDQDTSEGMMETNAGVTEVAGAGVLGPESRLSPDSSRRDSDALIVNPPVTLQADILQNEKCGSDIAVSSSGSPVMVTSFASLSFPTTSSSITNVCSDVQSTVPDTLVSAPSTPVPLPAMLPVCTVSASKPVGQNTGFLKISPTKGPSSPNVTKLSFGAGKTPSISSSSASVATTKLGGTRILGSGATLTIGSTISALSGSSVTLTRQGKSSASASTGNTNSSPINILGSIPVEPIHDNTVPSKEGMSFPNLVPADTVCHNDAITLNSGQQPSTQPTTSTQTLSFGSAISVGCSADSGSVPGAGLGMSLLNILDGSSVQGEASQSCMSDILAKAMKSADINMTDAEISMSMDFMNNFIAANFKHPGSRNASPLKNPPSSGAMDPGGLQQVPDLTVSLQEHLMKAGIINKPQTGVSEIYNIQMEPGQNAPVTASLPLSTMGNVFVTETLPVYTSNVSEIQTQPSGVNVSSSIPYTTVGFTGNIGTASTTASQFIVDPSHSQVIQGNNEAVTSTEQIYQYVQSGTVTEGQFVSIRDQPGTGSVQIITSNEHVYVQAGETDTVQCVTGNVASTLPRDSMNAAPAPDEPMEVQDDTEVEWTKDMDKLCLEMCKRCGSTEETFSQIAEKLKVVTPNEVSARFDKLMQLLSTIDESENDSD